MAENITGTTICPHCGNDITPEGLKQFEEEKALREEFKNQPDIKRLDRKSKTLNFALFGICIVMLAFLAVAQVLAGNIWLIAGSVVLVIIVIVIPPWFLNGSREKRYEQFKQARRG